MTKGFPIYMPVVWIVWVGEMLRGTVQTESLRVKWDFRCQGKPGTEGLAKLIQCRVY